MASILADNQYTLEQFKTRESLGNIPELNEDIIEKINKLAKRVGAPTYQKTPVFKRNNHHYQKKLKKENISNEDWEAIRNFKKTKLEKNVEGLAAKIDDIRSYLNKLTDKNYDEMFDAIVDIIKEIVSENDNNTLETVGKHIFEIGCLNKFWSGLYAKLYKDLIGKYPIMREICIKNFNSFEDIFNTINFANAQENYNLFCEYNKQNEKRRALSDFFIVCCGYDIIDKNKMQEIIVNFFQKIEEYKNDATKTELIEEIVANLSIIILKGHTFLKELDKYDIIETKIEEYSSMVSKKYPGFSQKVIFKFMDIQDTIED